MAVYNYSYPYNISYPVIIDNGTHVCRQFGAQLPEQIIYLISMMCTSHTNICLIYLFGFKIFGPDRRQRNYKMIYQWVFFTQLKLFSPNFTRLYAVIIGSCCSEEFRLNKDDKKSDKFSY